MRLPRYVTAKKLRSGATGFYWHCPRLYRDQGCPWHSGALGEGLSQAEIDATAKVWNDRFDEWKAGSRSLADKAAPEAHHAYGTVGWLLDYYQTSKAFLERVSEPSRPDYARIFKRVSAIVSTRTGRSVGQIPVREFGVPIAEKVYEHFADGGALRTAEKALMYCETAWARLLPHFPALFRKDVPNPWNGVTKRRRVKLKKGHADRATTYRFAWGAVENGRPELGAAAVLAFEWLMRPSSISAGFASWPNYRSASAPTKIKIRHRKNGGEVDHPLEATIDGAVVKFYEEAERVLAKVPRRGLSIVTKPDGQLFGDTTLLPKAIREMADGLGMTGFTLDKARHGGMTELEETELTEGQGKALSTHTTSAYRVYAKETEERVLRATMKRFGYSETPKNPIKSARKKVRNEV